MKPRVFIFAALCLCISQASVASAEAIEVKSPSDGLVLATPPKFPSTWVELGVFAEWSDYDLLTHSISTRLSDLRCKVIDNVSGTALTFDYKRKAIFLEDGTRVREVKNLRGLECSIFADDEQSSDPAKKLIDPLDTEPEVRTYYSPRSPGQQIPITANTFKKGIAYNQGEKDRIVNVSNRARKAVISTHECGDAESDVLISVAPAQYEETYLRTIRELLFLIEELDYALIDLYRFLNKIGPRNEAVLLSRIDTEFHRMKIAGKSYGDVEDALDKQIRYASTRKAAMRSNAYSSLSDYKQLIGSAINDVENATAEVFRASSRICLGTIKCPRGVDCSSFVPSTTAGFWVEKGDVIGYIDIE